MKSKSIFYQYPELYINGLKLIHKANFSKRYRFMASFVRPGDKVLEPACGPAVLADYLPSGSSYQGFDTNQEFINYASQKHSSVYIGNVLDLKSYTPSDIVIVCDILHHLKPSQRKQFIQNCYSSAQKIFIVCEPGKEPKTKTGMLDTISKHLDEYSESDGTCDFKTEYFSTRSQLQKQIKQGFGVIPTTTKRICSDFGEDIVSVFFKNEKIYQIIKNQKTISAVVPVFNEETTVSGVVKVLQKNSLINEIVCINDGSTDNSLNILKNFKNSIKLINLPKNKGKGFALVEGIKRAKGDVVVFIDADLTNLSDIHINSLLQPILESNYKVVLGYPSGGWLQSVLSDLTGERVYYKSDLLPLLIKMAKTRFGVEIFLNSQFPETVTKKIHLKYLKDLLKYEKRNSIDAFREYLNEAVEIALEIGRREGLLPTDYQTISQISKAVNPRDLITKIKAIQNKPARRFLEKYVLNYAKIVQKWWVNF